MMASAAQTQAATWTIDASHSQVEFSVKHMMISTVKGRFGVISGKLVGDPNDLVGAQIEVEIDAASVDTRAADRDTHLRSADFFDVENHPTLHFASRKIESTGDGEYRMTGDLTIRGVSKPVELDVEFSGTYKDPWGGMRAGFSATGVLDRKEFGLIWNTALEAGGVLVSDRVKMEIDVQLVQQQGA